MKVRQNRGRKSLSVMFVAALLLSAGSAETQSAAPPAKPEKSGKPKKHDKHPNILFFIMDDVGIDQMKVFGYGGATAPKTPNIDAIARGGLRFRNTWAMPQCSPSRASIITGRYPLRTNIQAVISSTVLANSQVSPFEVTVPKLLAKAGYESAMFGKFHLAGPDNNPYGHGGPLSLGFDDFHGVLEGEPYPLDTYAGTTPPEGSGDVGPYGCGFVSGSPSGVCRFADGSCEAVPGLRPGLRCIANGGLFDEGGHCLLPPTNSLDFNVANAYYVSPLVLNHSDGTVDEVPYTDPRSRGYRTTLEVDAAREWIQQRDAEKPWMATVSFSSAHVPYQPAPPSFLFPSLTEIGETDCTSDAAVRHLSNETTEAMDTELGRLVVELGLATRNQAGELVYDPSATDTMIVIVGDNGTYAPVVKAPFDPVHSKGTAYQTGVWVPLIVAGPLAKKPDREVTHMVNVADLFTLFGEIAAVDVRKEVPASHHLDSVSMLPYLTNPSQKSLRKTNFTQGGTSITAGNEQQPPCVIPVSTGVLACVQLFPIEEVCTNQRGEWYGPGAEQEFSTCCDVMNSSIYKPEDGLKILPMAARAIRNEHYKLLEKEVADCATPDENDVAVVTEFYEVNEAPNFPLIERPEGDDLPPNNLLPGGADPKTLPSHQRRNFRSLQKQMRRLLASEVPCPGDGNLDKEVNDEDLEQWEHFQALSGGTSTWYDFNYDGFTDAADREIIEQHLGTKCIRAN